MKTRSSLEAPESKQMRQEDCAPFMVQKLEQLRTRLLDLSLANRLLNFKHSSQGRSFLRIVNDTPSLLWQRLRRQSLPFCFLPPIEEPEDESKSEFFQAWQTARLSDSIYLAEMQALEDQDTSLQCVEKMQVIDRSLKDRLRQALGLPSRIVLTSSFIEHAKRHGINPSFDLPREGTANEKSVREGIQLLLPPKLAEQQLSYVRDAAYQRLEETGINMLFCAFGFLQWYETDDSSVPLYAPLVLLPVEIKREIKEHQFIYTLAAIDEDPTLNLTLKEKLKQLGLVLPDWEEEDSPETYWQRLEKALQSQKKWKICRWVTVGIFPSSRMAMYEDLDPNHFELIQHPQTRDLLLGQEGEAYYTSIPLAKEEEKEQVFPLLVSKVDSSQYAAICKALQCPSLVIKGPPGTGKSQTITNLIAASLFRGENVLFIADKQAALNVVYSRLKEAGLAEFCLELHSHQATRASVIHSLKKRIEMIPTGCSEKLEEKIKEFQETHQVLDHYTHFMQRPLGQSQQTIQSILWAARHASDRGDFPAALFRTYFEQVELISPANIQNAKKLLRSIEKAYDIAIGEDECLYNHPWRGITKISLSPFQIEELHELFGKLLPLVIQMEIDCHSFTKKYDAKLNSVEEIEQFEKALSQILDLMKNIELSTLSRCEDAEWRSQIKQLEETIQQLEELSHSLQIDYAHFSSFSFESLEKMDALWHSLTSPPASLFHLEQEIEHVNRQVHGLEQLMQLCSEITHLFGLKAENLTLSSMQSLWLAIQELVRTPFSLLKWRHLSLYSNESYMILQQTQQKALALQTRALQLKKKFKLDKCEKHVDITSHWRTLEQRHLLSFLNPSFRRAQKFYHSIILEPCNPTNTMAKDLQELDHFISECKKIEQDPILHALCGPYFMGIETDFSHLIDCAQFGLNIQKRFAQQDHVHQAIRLTLLEGKEEILQQLSTYIKHPMTFALNYFLSSSYEHRERTLSYLAESWKSYQKQLIEIQSYAKANHLPPTFQFENLTQWLHKGQSLQQVWQKWENLHSMIAHPSAASFAQVQKTLLYWELVHQHSPLAPLAYQLLGPSVKEIQDELHTFAEKLRQQIKSIKMIWESIQKMGEIDETIFFDPPDSFANQSWLDLRCRIENCLQYPDKLNRWSTLGEALASAKQEGLDIIFRPFLEEKRALHHLCEAYHMVVYRSLARYAYTLDHGLLSRFKGLDQEQALARLMILEQEIIQLSKERLRSFLFERPLPTGVGHGKKATYTEFALIKHEASKQKRHIAIRQLMQRAREALCILKPCFLMSPLSLAQYLPRNSLQFDLLVIDEASQMRPEEAIGAISRAKRVVIVGDPLQLPPTDFFVKMDNADLEDEEEAMSHESILDLALATFPHVCDLRWHYRSQHASLIAFSNHHFYNNRLIVLPSAHPHSEHLGVKWVHVAGTYQNGLNLIESQAVIQTALDYMQRYPDRSLGIVTLNSTQRDLLLEEFEYAIRHSPQAAAYIKRWELTLQAPFVKNLENVQGDERDTILISMVYGPNAHGNVAQHFGPINKLYGHRRLNVLFTRARSHLIVFSSLLPDQIKSEGKNPGVGILKHYLEFAATGKLERGYEHSLEPESDFEKCVAEKIHAMGCKATPQVGVAGYRIDIGVSHPSYPYGYLLGIECDGAAYHSSQEARIRDRLRQDILEKLGWTIYRIWSTDWFRDPATQTKRLQNFIENLLRSRKEISK